MSIHSEHKATILQELEPRPEKFHAILQAAAQVFARSGFFNARVSEVARAAGVEPHLDNWPDLHRALLFGPLAPSCFRLEGPDALPDAAARFARDASAFGAITSNELTEREQTYWSLVSTATR